MFCVLYSLPCFIIYKVLYKKRFEIFFFNWFTDEYYVWQVYYAKQFISLVTFHIRILYWPLDWDEEWFLSCFIVLWGLSHWNINILSLYTFEIRIELKLSIISYLLLHKRFFFFAEHKYKFQRTAIMFIFVVSL